jgi:hypothetical protein
VKRVMVVFSSPGSESLFHELVKRGVGINFRPRPKKERRFFGGVDVVVQS